jgi:hypothetical protein
MVSDVFLILPLDVGMLYKKRGSFYVYIPRVGCLFPTPLPDSLFSLKNGQLHYVVKEKTRTPVP